MSIALNPCIFTLANLRQDRRPDKQNSQALFNYFGIKKKEEILEIKILEIDIKHTFI